MFSLQEYQSTARPITFKLKNGQELEAKYFENYMTDQNLEQFEGAAEEADKEDSIRGLHAACRKHLAAALSDMTIKVGEANGKPKLAPCKTVEQRLEVLRVFSYQDLLTMIHQIAADMGRPTEPEEQTSSPGLLPKDDSAQADQTQPA